VRLPRPRSSWARVVLILAAGAALGALVWWRGPEWRKVGDAFGLVEWHWVVIAVVLNLLSVVARALAWTTVIDQAIPPPHPRFPLVFSAFSVGLFANAVLPGRVGELARVGVLTRKLPGRPGLWATLVGSVFAHRVFDLVPVVGLIAYVLATAKIPHWAFTSLMLVLIVGGTLFAFGLVTARRHKRGVLDERRPIRRILAMARQGLGVMRAPMPALIAIFCQCLGWFFQLLAVYAVLRAFDINEGIAVAALVLVLVNLATMFPLWPGNFGLVQAAIAIPLLRYDVAYATGLAFGVGLQAIEASVGVGVGTIFLAREGLSYAILKKMPDATEADELTEAEAEERELEAMRAPVS
jgi:uncharacterized protein (TIRG00374 family)